ncbi:Zinc ABC transporter, periplasmic-binding protein ZnuA [Rhodovulum sp. P5]|uniref:zinc ABC transporter substrate-binding protein n=1 Tax=Rhodovulum sp. P5 TaxID=1564506 RepID=UPI0009C1F05A|nr:zinc ABC transporter substrate-binding protein [Rhodovulum sp. P5]ARE40180.1 Zinc ABC transporter, periplasmic-binding protein ZnuA [Rhodovulum sp. P5]
MTILRAFALSLLASPALAAPPAVMTDIPPVHALAAAVMGDLATPGILLDQGADPHHFQLKPSQARALSEADLVFWIGPELTPWLERAIQGVGLSGESVELIETAGTHRRMFDEEDAHTHETHDDAPADMAKDGDDHDHMHEGIDPHAWLDPANARHWVDRIAGALEVADPENAETYRANAAAAAESIAATETEVRHILDGVGDAPIVVFHNAYAYFADHFGLNVAGAIALGDAADPGAARMKALRAELKHDHAVCLFPEAQHDPALVASIVEGTGVRVGRELDPSGSTLTYGPDLYDALLTGLAQTIADCVSAARS